MATNAWIELPVEGGGVTSLNGETGAVNIVAGSGISVTPSGQNITIATTGGGSGTVTSVSVVSANGLAGTVANPTTTPAITLSTSITGILQGNGTAISAATTGNLTDAGTDGIVVTGGTGAVLGSGTSLAQHVSDASHNGYLSSTDWSTFNGKQAAGSYITALTGDVTASGPGSVAATIANSAVTNAKLANMAAHTYKGNNTGSTAAPIDVTSTQLTADLNLFTSSLQGLVPASGGGTTNFLRADGTWAAAGGGGGTPFLQGGNAFGATGVLGTTDNNNLQIITNNTLAMTIDNTQALGIGTAPVSGNEITIQSTNTSSGFASGYGVKNTFLFTPTAGSFLGFLYGTLSQADVNSVGQASSVNIYGLYGLAGSTGTGNTGMTLTGVYGQASTSDSSGSVAVAIGVQGHISETPFASNLITTAYAGYFDMAGNSGSVTTGYGAYIGNISGMATTPFSLYASDASAPSYFAGSVGIGTSSPATKFQVQGVISPATDNTYTLGSASFRFTTVYATNAIINTSDSRMKEEIQSSDLGLDFISKLKPISYKWKNSEDKQKHYGFIAQEVEMETRSAIVDHDIISDKYGLRYTELIAPLVKAIQELTARVKQLEGEKNGNG